MKLQKIYFLGLSLLTFGLFFISCHNDEKDSTATIQQRPSMINLNLPYYSNNYDEENLVTETGAFNFVSNGLNYVTDIHITYDDLNDNLVQISISDNYIRETGVTKEEIESTFITELNNNKDENGGPKLSEHAACIQWCVKVYTDENGNKIKGRGACKANCWVDTAVRILEALSPL